MKEVAKKFNTVSEYFASLPPGTRKILKEVRNTIRKAAPEADELISYNIPAFTQQGRLVYYAAFKNHIGFYPRVSGIEAYKKELAKYKGAKGSVQFPLDKPMPLELIAKIVAFRVEENRKEAAAKKQAKKKS